MYNIKLETKITEPIALPHNGFIYPTNYFEEKVKDKLNIANHFSVASWNGKSYLETKYLADCYASCKDRLFTNNKINKCISKNSNININFIILCLSLSLTLIFCICKEVHFLYYKK